MKVISCFAGLGGAELALKRAGIQADIYTYEIDKYAEAVNRYNNPDSIFLGDITKWKEHTDMIGYVDLIIGGSPCQDLSCAGKCAGLQGARSGLFYIFLEMIKYYQPTYFILENVASMSNRNRDIITELMGVNPVMLNGALVSAQQRKRLFWTNIPTSDLNDKGIVAKDILENGSTGMNKTYCIPATYSNACVKDLLKHKKTQVFQPVRIGNIGNSTAQGNRVYSVTGKTVNLSSNGGGWGAKTGLYKIDLPDGNYVIRKLTPIEVERAFTIPDNYTRYGKFADGSIKEISNTQRYKMLGNSFVIDVLVEGILKNIDKVKYRINY